MAIQYVHSNFTAGELSPLLYSRIDFDGYYKGLKQARNTLILPQGGGTRRFGSILISEDIGTDDYTKIRMEEIEVNGDYYLFLFANVKILIYENDVYLGVISSPYPEDIVNELSMEQSNDKIIIAHEDYELRSLYPTATPEKYSLQLETIRNYPTYDFRRDYDNVTFTPSGTSGTKASPVTLTATGGSPFVPDHVGGLFFGNEGTMRITAYTSGTQVNGFTIVDFKDTSAIEGQEAYLAEPAFGNPRRKYTRRVFFYQGRMGLASTVDLPGLCALSASNDPTNFDDSTAEDSDAIVNLVTATGSSRIRFGLSAVNLFLFTDSGEFTTPPFSDKVATPSTTYYIQQTSNGIADIRPVVIDNRVLFVDKGGKIIREMFYSVQRSAYQAINISLLSAHLINSPVSMATFENPSLIDGVYMLLINGDGTLAVYQSMETQNIRAWTLCDTDGLYRQVVARDDQVYVLVERTINEASTPETKLYLEKIDFSVYTDCSKEFTFGSPQTVITGLDWLNEKTVYVTADGEYVGEKEVHNNAITLEKAASTVSLGLGSVVSMVPLRLNIQTSTGQTFYRKKRIKQVYLDFYESIGIKVNGKLIPSFLLDSDEIGKPPTVKSGIDEVTNMGGWSNDEEVVITQTDPLPLTIRSISYEVEV